MRFLVFLEVEIFYLYFFGFNLFLLNLEWILEVGKDYIYFVRIFMYFLEYF